MNVAALWERLTTITLWSQGVRSRWLELDAYRIYSLIYSPSRPPLIDGRVVCVHGLGSSGAAYGALMPHLKNTWREVWSPSAPGHGLSVTQNAKMGESAHHSSSSTQHALYLAWEDILLQLSDEAPIDLIAISLGGAISIRFAARYPERVTRLILCSPAGARLDEKDIEHLRSVFRMTERGDGMRFLRTLYHRPPWWSWWLSRLVQKSLSAPHAQEIINQLKPGDGLDSQEISDLTMPTLLIWGGRERVLPPSSLPYLVRHAPSQLTLKQPPHLSHSPQRECPEELAQLILTWIDDLLAHRPNDHPSKAL